VGAGAGGVAADSVRALPHRGVSFISMTTAWLGGIGLTAYYNNMFLPAAIFTNMIVCTLAWLIISLTVLKLLASFLIVLCPAVVAGKLLMLPLSFMRHLAEFSAVYGGVVIVPTPPLILTLAYYGLVAGFFSVGPACTPDIHRGIHGRLLHRFSGMPPSVLQS